MPDEHHPLGSFSPAPASTVVRDEALHLRAQPSVEPCAADVERERAIVSLREPSPAGLDGEQQVRDVLESIADGFYALDDEGRFTYVNSCFERITGRSRDELLGKVAWEVFGLARDSLPMRKYLEARETGRGQTYEAFIDRIGRWVEFRSFPGRMGHSAFVRDITEQRRQDEALRRSEERWRLAGQATSDLMYDWDIPSGALFMSESLRTGFGHTDAEPTIGWWKTQIHPDDIGPVVADLERVLASRDVSSWNAEYRFRRGDGAWVAIVDRGGIVRDDGGRAVRMVGAMQDVTERRRAERQLLQSQKMEVMGQLAAGVAHDFNNVLTAMFGYLELAETALQEWRVTVPELAEVRRAADQAAALTRQLLVFSRRQLDRPRSIDLGALLRESGGLLARLVGRGHRLDVRVPPLPWPVCIDPTHAEQILMNLVANARDAMPDAGIVTIALDNVLLDEPIADAVPSAVAPGAWVRLTVRDVGSGMDAATLARVWEPFFTTKGVGRGTGLGLPTVRGLVGRAGGGLAVDTAPGQGTTVSVYLPRASTPAERHERDEVSPGGVERVLLVEDDAAVRDALHRALERHGYSVVAPASVDAAVARLSGPVALDAVVLDAELEPKRGGGADSVLAAIAARHRRGASTPALVQLVGVVAEGNTPPEVRRRSIVVEKPFATDVLLRALRRALDGG